MNLDFDDLNCLIDDSTPVGAEKLDWITALQGKQIRVLELEFREDIQKLLKPPHFEAIQFSKSSIRFDENEVILETLVCEHFSCPMETREAFAAINQVRQRLIGYENVNGFDRLWCDKENPHRKRLDNQQQDKYIRAARYLPDLLRKNGEILVNFEQLERFAQFKKKYRIQALWIEYYLLGSSDVLTELGFKPPTERQYKPGKISARLHGLIQDMWSEAENNKNPLCQWILAFDCPSQVWLALEAILVLKKWNKQPPKNGFQLYQLEQLILNPLREYKGIKANLLYSHNKDENLLSLDQAFSFTLIRLLESGIELAQYYDYLNARTGQANLVRKGEKGKRSNRGFCTSK